MRLLRRITAGNKQNTVPAPVPDGESGVLPEPLTPRELEVVRLLAEGKTNRQIAQKVVISFATAKVHVEHIIAKLKVSDRAQAAWLVRGRPPSPRGVGTPALTPPVPPKRYASHTYKISCAAYAGAPAVGPKLKGCRKAKGIDEAPRTYVTP